MRWRPRNNDAIWRPFFAVLPVKCADQYGLTCWVWMEWVERKYCSSVYDAWYEYRTIESA